MTVTFRPLSEDDYPMLLEWLQRSHVRRWWDDGDDTLEKVAGHYSRDRENTKRFVAELNSQPIGYFQYHRFSEGYIGTDQFLADAEMLSKGLGTSYLLSFIELILRLERPNTISVDPHPGNTRAIRCYQKCGFVFAPDQSDSNTYLMLRQVNS